MCCSLNASIFASCSTSLSVSNYRAIVPSDKSCKAWTRHQVNCFRTLLKSETPQVTTDPSPLQFALSEAIWTVLPPPPKGRIETPQVTADPSPLEFALSEASCTALQSPPKRGWSQVAIDLLPGIAANACDESQTCCSLSSAPIGTVSMDGPVTPRLSAY